MFNSLLYQLILLFGLDNWLKSNRFVWYRRLSRTQSDNWTETQLRIGYYLLGRMILNLTRSDTYSTMLEDMKDDSKDCVILSTSDLDMLHFVRNGVESLALLEGWDKKSISDSAFYKILKKRKLEKSPELMEKYNFIMSFATCASLKF
jgi:hypothetical protein